jgi:hypothetical protein
VPAHSALPETGTGPTAIHTDGEPFARRTLVLAPVEGSRVAPVAGGGIATEQLAISAGPTSKWALRPSVDNFTRRFLGAHPCVAA